MTGAVPPVIVTSYPVAVRAKNSQLPIGVGSEGIREGSRDVISIYSGLRQRSREVNRNLAPWIGLLNRSGRLLNPRSKRSSPRSGTTRSTHPPRPSPAPRSPKPQRYQQPQDSFHNPILDPNKKSPQPQLAGHLLAQGPSGKESRGNLSISE